MLDQGRTNMPMTNEFIKELQNVTTEKQIHEFLVYLISGLELDYFLLKVSFPISMIKSDFMIIDNYPQPVSQLYQIENILKTDPIVDYCSKNHSPIFWGKVAPSELKDINRGLFPVNQSGFAVPLHGPMASFGMLNLSTGADKPNCDHILSEALTVFQIVMPYIQDAIATVRSESYDHKMQLTCREIECLTWATEGKSAWEIAHILGCSERTVTFHLNNATAKLKCTNRYQAIAKAILTGVILPNS
ncbi:helix-turn-helix transcriptional regulator [Psychromonas sp. PT13]|uniref:helix-turn-helix transcriptional regulator n=1 Tax=Psychromonas sp. PT13 TaxID=3439547 RepID=UPI003EBBADBB